MSSQSHGGGERATILAALIGGGATLLAALIGIFATGQWQRNEQSNESASSAAQSSGQPDDVKSPPRSKPVLVDSEEPSTREESAPASSTQQNSQRPAPKLTGDGAAAEQDVESALERKVRLASPYGESYPGAPVDRLSVQYAVIELLEQVGLEYDFRASQKNIGETARRWVTPEIHDLTCREALERVLKPLGLTFTIQNGKVVLKRS